MDLKFFNFAVKKRQPITGSLAQAGVLSRVTPRRNLEVRLPSKP